ncbi:MAG: hypothetical protein ACRENK_09340 [Gemmatimonadaceae bacterium]
MRRTKADRQTDDRIAGELAAKADSLSKRMLEVTVPIYLGTEKEPSLVGSAVLVTLAGDRFLITAGHVFDWRQHGPLLVGVSPELVSLAGTLWRIPDADSHDKSFDHIDLGIVRLNGGPWETLPLDRLCSWTELDIDAPLVERHTFGLMGFPLATNRQPIEGDRIKSFAFTAGGLECDLATYQAADRNPLSNLMIGYDHKTMSGAKGRLTAPALNGASGGGIWRFGRKLRETTRSPLLSAIFTEWHKGKHKYLFGTRVQVVVGLLTGQFPHVREFVEAELGVQSSAENGNAT